MRKYLELTAAAEVAGDGGEAAIVDGSEETENLSIFKEEEEERASL